MQFIINFLFFKDSVNFSCGWAHHQLQCAKRNRAISAGSYPSLHSSTEQLVTESSSSWKRKPTTASGVKRAAKWSLKWPILTATTVSDTMNRSATAARKTGPMQSCVSYLGPTFRIRNRCVPARGVDQGNRVMVITSSFNHLNIIIIIKRLVFIYSWLRAEYINTWRLSNRHCDRWRWRNPRESCQNSHSHTDTSRTQAKQQATHSNRPIRT